MATSTVTVSKWWLSTSPHYDEEHIKQKPADLAFIAKLQLNPLVYDFCMAEEVEPGGDPDVTHIHFAVRLKESYSPWWGGASEHLKGWNNECPGPQQPGEDGWQMMLDYVKKHGEYYHKREVIPYPYNVDEPVWKPWQQFIVDFPVGTRDIIVVVDEIGGVGKTFLAGWHAVRYKAIMVPPFDSHRDIIRMVFEHKVVTTVYIDVPRALSKRQMKAIYGAAETIKGGRVYDERYRWRQRWFDMPKVVIFTNDEPDVTQLSRDRWLFVYPRADGTYKVQRCNQTPHSYTKKANK